MKKIRLRFREESIDYIDVLVRASEKDAEVEAITRRIRPERSQSLTVIDEYDRSCVIGENDILTITSDAKNVRIRTVDGEYRARQSMQNMLDTLNETAFLRISRFEIVNLSRVVTYDSPDPGTLRLEFSDGSESWASRRYIPLIKETLSGKGSLSGKNLKVKGITNHIFCDVMKKKGAGALKHLDTLSRSAVSFSESTLLNLIKNNSDTEYGKKYHFDKIKTIDDFKKNVPFSIYDDYAPYIEKMITENEENLITTSPIRHYAVSSGSAGTPKLIPVSQATLDNYDQYATAFFFGVMDEYYRNTTGKSFKDGYVLNTLESVPMMTENGIPKGVISGTLLRPMADMLGKIMTSPAEIMFPESDMDMKYLKLRFALEQKRVIGIASPFMTAAVDLMAWLSDNWESMCDDIEAGVIGDEVMLPDELRDRFETSLRPNPGRADELRKEFEKGFEEILPRIWPDFQWVGAVGTGGFLQYTQKMRQYTGKNIPFSYMNYAASEAMMAVARRTGDESFVLIPDSGFYEFIPADSDGEETLTIDEIEVGKDYEIVLTNLSGFYRYRIGDVVRVTGFYNKAPMIAFLYRKNQMVSIAGEKTNEEALRWAIDRFTEDTGLFVRDYSVYADTESSPGRYVILIEPDEEIDPDRIPTYRDIIENRLGEANPSFGAKIESGTLGRTRLCITQQEAYMFYRDLLILKGVSPNQLKPVRVIDSKQKEDFFFHVLDYETE